MKKDVRRYPALLSEDGASVCVRFPDLPGCNTFGKGYADAIAKDALGGTCSAWKRTMTPSQPPLRSTSCSREKTKSPS